MHIYSCTLDKKRENEPGCLLEFDHAILRNLVIRHWLPKLTNSVEKEVPDFGNGLNFEFLDDLIDVETRPGISETLLLQKCNLVLQILKLNEKFIFRDGGLDNHPKKNSIITEVQGFLMMLLCLRDHMFRDDHIVDKLREFSFDGLTVSQFDIHLDGLLLEGQDLLADAAQVGLEREQHVLHSLQDLITVDDLVVEGGDVAALADVVGDRLVLLGLQLGLDLCGVLAEVNPATQGLLHHGVFQIGLDVGVRLLQEVVLRGKGQHGEDVDGELCCWHSHHGRQVSHDLAPAPSEAAVEII